MGTGHWAGNLEDSPGNYTFSFPSQVKRTLRNKEKEGDWGLNIKRVKVHLNVRRTWVSMDPRLTADQKRRTLICWNWNPHLQISELSSMYSWNKNCLWKRRRKSFPYCSRLSFHVMYFRSGAGGWPHSWIYLRAQSWEAPIGPRGNYPGLLIGHRFDTIFRHKLVSYLDQNLWQERHWPKLWSLPRNHREKHPLAEGDSKSDNLLTISNGNYPC